MEECGKDDRLGPGSETVDYVVKECDSGAVGYVLYAAIGLPIDVLNEAKHRFPLREHEFMCLGVCGETHESKITSKRKPPDPNEQCIDYRLIVVKDHECIGVGHR